MTNVTSIGNAVLEQLLGKARDAAAADSPGGMSTGEALGVALVLNRPDWLAAQGATIAEAMERVGPIWCRLVPVAARQLERDAQQAAYARAETSPQARHAQVGSTVSRLHGDADDVGYSRPSRGRSSGGVLRQASHQSGDARGSGPKRVGGLAR